MTTLRLPSTPAQLAERRPSRSDSEPLQIGVIAPPWEEVPPPAYGGIELMLDALARGLAGLGHEVKLFTVGSSTCEVERLSLFDKPAEVIGDGITGLRHAAAAYDRLDGCDVIHDHSIAGVFLASYNRDALQMPVLTTNHGPAGDPNLADIYRRAHKKVPVVAISHDQARRSRLEAWVPAVIHNGIDLARYRARLGDPDEGPLLALGRMSPVKGVDLAIQVARRAGRELLIAAKMREPAERRYFSEVIEPLLGNSVEFVGEVGHHEKVELLTRAAALVNPVRWHEPFGLVMIEALACGTPVLATPNGAAPELIQPGITGHLASSGNDEATIISELAAATRTLAQINRTNCRRAVIHRFSMEAMAQAHEQLYRRLIRQHRADTANLWAPPTVDEADTMDDLLTRALRAIGVSGALWQGRDHAAAAMARWLKDNHPGFAQCPLRYGERAANAFLDTGTVQPTDPSRYIATWNSYQSQLFHRATGH